jgi:hypothetical protein
MFPGNIASNTYPTALSAETIARILCSSNVASEAGHLRFGRFAYAPGGDSGLPCFSWSDIAAYGTGCKRR